MARKSEKSNTLATILKSVARRCSIEHTELLRERFHFALNFASGTEIRAALETLSDMILPANACDIRNFAAHEILDIVDLGYTGIPFRGAALTGIILDHLGKPEQAAEYFLKSDKPASSFAGFVRAVVNDNIEGEEDGKYDPGLIDTLKEWLPDIAETALALVKKSSIIKARNTA